MAVYSFDTSTLQEDAITFKRTQVNADRQAMNPPQPPFEDNQTYVQLYVLPQMFSPILVEYVNDRTNKIADAYRIASDATRKAVDSALKLA